MRFEQVERLADLGRPMDGIAHRRPRESAQDQVVDLRAHHRKHAVWIEDDEGQLMQAE